MAALKGKRSAGKMEIYSAVLKDEHLAVGSEITTEGKKVPRLVDMKVDMKVELLVHARADL
jgi:hypothetical protein